MEVNRTWVFHLNFSNFISLTNQNVRRINQVTRTRSNSSLNYMSILFGFRFRISISVLTIFFQLLLKDIICRHVEFIKKNRFGKKVKGFYFCFFFVYKTRTERKSLVNVLNWFKSCD